MEERIVVGVSGGVDSVCSCLRLLDMGFDVRPVFLFMRNGLSDLDAARLKQLEDVTGLSVERVDCRETFARRVVDVFLAEMEAGRTPNPCVICNEALKVRLLFEVADQLGRTKVATGHYARIVETPSGPRLSRAASAKDQSYMLYRLPVVWLPRLVFPLCDAEKNDVRREAIQRLGTGMGGGDSQDICFLGGQRLADFLHCHAVGPVTEPGDMVDEAGRIVGRHAGLALYTLGQRKGLGLGGGPWFVQEKDMAGRRLLLGHQERCETSLTLTRANWHDRPDRDRFYLVQTRYRSTPHRCRVALTDESTARLIFDEPQSVSAPGQSAVVYDGDRLVGGGIIVLSAGSSTVETAGTEEGV